METRPSKITETLVGCLIPQACREHVLGDLHERYTGTWQYLTDAVSTIPLVIASRVRRTIDPQRFVADAVALYGAFFASAWQLNSTGAFHESVGLAKLAIPVIAGLCALVLRDAYAGIGNAPALASAVLGGVVALLAAAAVYSGIPNWIMVGATTSALLLASLRWLLLSSGRQPIPKEVVPRDIRQRALDFEAKIRKRNRREFIAAAVVVLAFSGYMWFLPPGVLFRISCGLIIAGTLYMSYHLYRHGTPRTVPSDTSRPAYVEFYRAELVCQRDLLRGIGKWYLGPLTPGLLLFILNGFIARPEVWLGMTGVTALCIIVFVLVWKANDRAAKRLQEQLDALEKQP